MAQQILSFSAGAYDWAIYLEPHPDGTYSLSALQSVLDGETECDPIDPVGKLRGGAKLYDALVKLVLELGYAIDWTGGEPLPNGAWDLSKIAARIAEVDPVLARQFRSTPGSREQRQQIKRARSARSWAAALRPHQEAIERYVQQFSDEPKRHLGIPYPSRRHWMRLFIENYVIAKGHLPTGMHDVMITTPAGDGYIGGQHDFTGLGDEEQIII